MIPARYISNDEKTEVYFKYTFTQLREFIELGRRDGNVGMAIVSYVDNMITWKGFGTIENPRKTISTTIFKHLESFDGVFDADEYVSSKSFLSDKKLDWMLPMGIKKHIGGYLGETYNLVLNNLNNQIVEEERIKILEEEFKQKGKSVYLIVGAGNVGKFERIISELSESGNTSIVVVTSREEVPNSVDEGCIVEAVSMNSSFVPREKNLHELKMIPKNVKCLFEEPKKKRYNRGKFPKNRR
jgi:hypothetical protein